jgi:membrane-anchored protein YejM (alkaline phosphatase superfamily)
MRVDRRALLRETSWFFLAVSALLFLSGARYLLAFTWPDEWLARAYAVSAALGHFTLLAMVPWLVLVLPLVLLAPGRAQPIRVLCVVVSAALMAFVQIDSLVFAADRFHVSALALRVLGASTWLFTGVYFAVGLALCALLLRAIARRANRSGAGRRAAQLTAALGGLYLASQAVHAWADVRYHVPVTSFTPYLPLYRPLTGKTLLSRWLGSVDLSTRRAAVAVGEMADVQDALLDYPKQPLRCTPPPAPLNVLVIGLDAMRADMVTPRITPHITRFAADALPFESHWSGGNGTRPGLFSLFYGIPATYWFAFYSAQRPPVLIETFQAHGYRMGIFPGNPSDQLVGLDRTAFRSVPDLPNTAGDVAVTDGWLGWIAAHPREQPFFAFLFYESAPGGCVPGRPRVSDVPVDAPGDAGRKSCYETALHFADGEVARALEGLDASGLRQRTVVIVTSDHGEEFNETGAGFRGHGSGYSRYQLQTPMLIQWPGRAAGTQTHRTSHNDFAPTLLGEVLGCSNDPSDYSSGQSLFAGQSWDWLVAASYTSHAILEPDQVTVSYGSYYEVRDRDYHLLPDPRPNGEVLARALRETGRFLAR